jgi:acetyltransferase-like isoleucine patch superfamily enzyme
MPSRSWSQTLGTLLNCGRESLSGFWALEARFKGCSLGQGVRFCGRPVVSVSRGSRLVIGDGVRIQSSLRSNPLGCFQPSILRTLSPRAELVLERQVGISATVLCAAVSIHIGEGTIIGAGAMIVDNDFHHPVGNFGWADNAVQSAKPVRIGRGAFIGARAIVLKGVTIGDRAVIGAGAVVTCDVPDRHLAVGNPARIQPWKGAPPAE